MRTSGIVCRSLQSLDLGGGLGGLELVENRDELVDRDPAVGDEARAGLAEVSGERRRPRVLVDEDRRRRARLERRAGLVVVLLAEEARRRALEQREVESPVSVEVADRTA